MKQSEQYEIAMKGVIRMEGVTDAAKLEIIRTLLEDQKIAKYREKEEQGQEAKQ